jgi:hypothetical protein
MKHILIWAAVVATIAGCSLRMYGNLKCDGPCELTLEREAGELDVIPDPVKTVPTPTKK